MVFWNNNDCFISTEPSISLIFAGQFVIRLYACFGIIFIFSIKKENVDLFQMLPGIHGGHHDSGYL